MTTSSVFDLALPGIQKLIPYTPGKPIEELERELGLSEIIKLASNENPLGPSPRVTDAIKQALPEITRYPDGNGFKLKTVLAEKYGVELNQITLGNGSNEILELVARTFLTPDLNVVFSQHAFAVYPLVTQAVGAQAQEVAARDYGHDLAAMRAHINDKTRLVFIANPNNPTGTLLAADVLEEFIASLPAHVICVLDEAYYEYVDPAQRADSIAWLARYPNLLITRTFSKAYGLAGLRVGFGLASAEMSDLLNRVRQPFNNNALALVAAETALQDQDYLQHSVVINNAGMQLLTEAFGALGLNSIPSAGNFVSVDFGRDAQPIYQALLQKGVIVRPVVNYGMPTFLRISVGTDAENRFFIQALRDVLNHV